MNERDTYELVRLGDSVVDVKRNDDASPTGVVYERWTRGFWDRKNGKREVEMSAQSYEDFLLSMNDVDNAVHVSPDASIQVKSKKVEGKKRFRKATHEEEKEAFFYPLELDTPQDAFEVARYTKSLLMPYRSSDLGYSMTFNIRHCEAAFKTCRKWYEQGEMEDSGKLAKILVQEAIELTSNSTTDYLERMDKYLEPFGIKGQLEFQESEVTSDMTVKYLGIVDSLLNPQDSSSKD